MILVSLIIYLFCLQVKFDGMGPTWQQVVEVGIKKYPEGTHGILADADFMPLQDKMDKWQLDVRCSKHMFTIWTQDHKNERKMDWIYRNMYLFYFEILQSV
jgi:hypothetical protein